MEASILEESKDKLVVSIKGEDHTFCNLLREELTNDKDVTVAAYRINHPLVGIPNMLIETKGKDPKKALLEATARIKKTFEGIKKSA